VHILDDTALRHGPISAPEDLDLRDEFARSARRRWLFAAIVALDTFAILAFVVWVAMPRLT
jgi:uncharacterized protein involved in exopolysaccharide biosynthesis